MPDAARVEPGAAILLLHDERAHLADALAGRVRAVGYAAVVHGLSLAARASDRAARAEVEAALTALERTPGVERGRAGIVGLGRGGTCAFLLGCTRTLAAVVDVEGPVLYPDLSVERPIQPLELALNLEGAFLGLFAREGAVGAAELALLRERLVAAARPFELDVRDGGWFDPGRGGYDARIGELQERVLAFLNEHLSAP